MYQYSWLIADGLLSDGIPLQIISSRLAVVASARQQVEVCLACPAVLSFLGHMLEPCQWMSHGTPRVNARGFTSACLAKLSEVKAQQETLLSVIAR